MDISDIPESVLEQIDKATPAELMAMREFVRSKDCEIVEMPDGSKQETLQKEVNEIQEMSDLLDAFKRGLSFNPIIPYKPNRETRRRAAQEKARQEKRRKKNGA